MAGVKFIANRLIQWIEGSTKDGPYFQFFLVSTDKPVRKVIQKYHCWGNLNEAICDHHNSSP